MPTKSTAKPSKKALQKRLAKNKLETTDELIIVESPYKCGKIAECVGSGYKCIASCGHIRTVNKLGQVFSPVDPHLERKYSICEDKLDIVDSMRREIAQYPKSNVILATDDDREGEAIAWHICKVFGLPVETTRRVVFHSITRDEIMKALECPRLIDLELVKAQQSRQTLDLMVGFKTSPFVQRCITAGPLGLGSNDGKLSAGRCQTPALRLIYDAHQKTLDQDGTGIGKYKLKGFFIAPKWECVSCTEFPTASSVEDFMRRSLAPLTHTLRKPDSPKDYNISPPSPFNTSRMLQVASSKLGLTTKQTTALCQQLFQEGHITYIRTDAKTYSPEFLAKIGAFIEDIFGPKYLVNNPTTPLTDKAIDPKANKLEPHEAIRPTDLRTMGFLPTKTEDEEGNSKKKALYRLIWTNTVESCMPSCSGKRTKIVIEGPVITETEITGAEVNKGCVVEYVREIEVPLFAGWKRVACWTESEFDAFQHAQRMDIDLINEYFANKSAGETVKIDPHRLEAEWTESKPPFYYSEPALIQKLEKIGIGRPSTYSYLVDVIQERGYVSKKNIEGREIICFDFMASMEGGVVAVEKHKTFGKQADKLVIEPLGISVVEYLMSVFERLFDYGYTANMESQLDAVARGELEPFVVEKACFDLIVDCTTSEFKKSEKQGENKCETKNQKQNMAVEFPIHGSNYCVRFTRNGPVVSDTSTSKLSDEKNGEKVRKYLPMKKGIVVERTKLEKGEYRLEDLVEWTDPVLGTYEGETMVLKLGPFGAYVEWGSNRKSIAPLFSDKSRASGLNSTTAKPTLDEVARFLSEKVDNSDMENRPNNPTAELSKNNNNKKILRVFTPEISVRMGKFGPYVFVASIGSSVPKFYGIKGLKEGYLTCSSEYFLDWLKKTHGV